MEGDYDDNDDDEVERESGIAKEDTGANEDSSSSSSDSESSDDESGAEGVGNSIIRKTTSVDEDSDEYEDEGSDIEIEAEEEAGSDDEEGARINAALQREIEQEEDEEDEDGDRSGTEARGLIKEESISVEELEEIINGSSPSSPNERAIDDTGSDMVSFAFVLLLFFVFVPFNDLLTHIMPRLIFLSYGIPSPGSIRCRGLGIGHRRNDFG